MSFQQSTESTERGTSTRVQVGKPEKRIGDHVLEFGHGESDWCTLCGTFSCYLMQQGKPIPCQPKPEADRFWAVNHRSKVNIPEKPL